MRYLKFTSGLLIGMFVFAVMPASSQETTYLNAAKEFRGPLTYKDVKSDILFYVESDGRHVSAIAPNGKIVWTKDPFIDAKLKSYRVANPRIIYIGAETQRAASAQRNSDQQVAISYDSTQFGTIDVKTGKFTFSGQD